MKKRLLTILAILLLFCSIMGLSACNDSAKLKINFVVDSTTVKTIETTGTEIISMPKNPTKEGYSFDGWYWDKEEWQSPLTTNSILNAPLSSDMSVYAKWKSDVKLSSDGTTVTGLNNNVTNLVILEQYDGYSNKVTKIDNYAFYRCRALTSVTIPYSVTSIGNYAFSGCYKLVEVIDLSNLYITKGSINNGDVGCYALNIKISGTSDIVNKTVFIIGSGSTSFLKMPMTKEQDDIFYQLKNDTSDLLAYLREIMNSMFGEKNYSINDIYNIIDSNLLLHNSLQCDKAKIEHYELEKCKRDLITLIFKYFTSKFKIKEENKYKILVDFYKKLAEKEVFEKINSKLDFQDREFFISSYSIINFNWDLYSLLPIIEAAGQVNHERRLCFAKDRNPEIRIYTDFNCEYASKDKDGELWYPYTEPAGFNVNSKKYDTTRRVVLTKCFYPHGAMNLFKCTSCAKHSYYLGDLTLNSVINKIEYDSKNSLYKCPYCGNEIYSTDFDILTQSNFKVRNSFLEETRLSMMKELRSAETLVFIGYSMPPDDVDYITMFKSLNCSAKKVYTILHTENAENKFIKYTDLDSESKKSCENFDKVFKDKVLYNMAGFPNSIDELLNIIK